MSFDIMISQLDQSLESKFYFLALATALSVPDIAAAIDSDDGRASGSKYKNWYDKWVLPRFSININRDLRSKGITFSQEYPNPFSGEECYLYRCSMLHQAKSTHERSAFSRVMFIEPKSSYYVDHYGVMDDALTIDLPLFCREVIDGYTDWKQNSQGTENYEKNIANTVQRYENGLKPYVVGVPIIT